MVVSEPGLEKLGLNHQAFVRRGCHCCFQGKKQKVVKYPSKVECTSGRVRGGSCTREPT